ncbi:MAG: nucleotidyltransferase [Acidobacteriota bacterium]|nr:nucleotidyltransferase [Acidobacteriota bacterium]
MLNPDFKDMLSCLNGEQVEFMIVGAYALAAHGHVRATGDIDIWVRNSADNAPKIMRALKIFGAPTANISETDFLLPDLILQIGVAPCRIDIITGIDGVAFDDAWQNKMVVTIDGININILSKPDLLKNKTAAGREKDQGDIAWLKKNP